LCHDNIRNKWRAVKINSAIASATTEYGDNGSSACQHLRETSTFEERENHHIVLPLKSFQIDGPNGRHLCEVLPLLGPSLSGISDVYGHCESLLKHICYQIVEAMDFLHSKNVCHGDYRPQNILFRLADGVEEWPAQRIVEALGRRRVVPVRPFHFQSTATNGDTDHPERRPRYLVQNASIDYGCGDCVPRVAVIDFGLAYIGQARQRIGTPLPYAAPEELLCLPTSGPKTDIWSLACTIYHVMTGMPPFAREEDDLKDTMRGIEAVLGPLPREHHTQWEALFPEFSPYLAKLGYVAFDPNLTTLHARLLGRAGGGGSLLGRVFFEDRLLPMSTTEAREIASQDYQTTRRLPKYSRSMRVGNWTPVDPQFRLKPFESRTVLRGQVHRLMSLIMAVFKWKPDERATTQDLLNHRWLVPRTHWWHKPPFNRLIDPKRWARTQQVREAEDHGILETQELPADPEARGRTLQPTGKGPSPDPAAESSGQHLVQ
jgi:serine/threonine protein kinase